MAPDSEREPSRDRVWIESEPGRSAFHDGTGSLVRVAGSGDISVPIALQVAAPTVALAPRQRDLALDVVRGFAVVGMILVNALASSRQSYGFQPTLSFLAHSAWAGFTFADFVFPAFIFICGISIAYSLRDRRANGTVLRQIAARSGRLFLLGLVLTNILWRANPDEGPWRLLGVLQRIGLCYFVAASLFVLAGWRTRLACAIVVLLLYWPLAELPLPADQHVDLLLPGANFVSWTDRLVLGTHALVTGPRGYDPEGLLSTLPAVAQCVLGSLIGQWLLKNGHRADVLARLGAIGAVMLALGLLWSPLFPIVKDIWTSSFVLVSAGLATLLVAAAYWTLNDRPSFLTAFFEAFGVNAALAYTIHIAAELIPAGNDMHAIGVFGKSSPELTALLPPIAFIAILWVPLEIMRRRRWFARI